MSKEFLSLKNQLASFGVLPASEAVLGVCRFLVTHHKELDTFLGGGLPMGFITEMGLPLGLGGRRLVLQFLSTLREQSILWVNPETDLFAFAPAWAAYGVRLSDIGFVRTDHPVRDLKPALFDPLYRLIVFDFPAHFSKHDQALLAKLARLNRNIILVLRNDFLKEEKGNIWARLRLNCWRNHNQADSYEVEVIRGLSPRRCTIRFEEPRYL